MQPPDLASSKDQVKKYQEETGRALLSDDVSALDLNASFYFV